MQMLTGRSKSEGSVGEFKQQQRPAFVQPPGKELSEPESAVESQTQQVNMSDQPQVNEVARRARKATMDGVSIKLLNAVESIIESRDVVVHQLEERDRELRDKENDINEILNEVEFVQKKIEKLTSELARTQEQVSDHKMQYEQLSNEFNSYRTQSESDIVRLHDDIEERDFKNRQLLVDLNKVRKESATRIQDLETRERELKAKQSHLDEKYTRALAENERLLEIINDFASQASTFSKRQASGSEQR